MEIIIQIRPLTKALDLLQLLLTDLEVMGLQLNLKTEIETYQPQRQLSQLLKMPIRRQTGPLDIMLLVSFTSLDQNNIAICCHFIYIIKFITLTATKTDIL